MPIMCERPPMNLPIVNALPNMISAITNMMCSDVMPVKAHA